MLGPYKVDFESDGKLMLSFFSTSGRVSSTYDVTLGRFVLRFPVANFDRRLALEECKSILHFKRYNYLERWSACNDNLRITPHCRYSSPLLVMGKHTRLREWTDLFEYYDIRWILWFDAWCLQWFGRLLFSEKCRVRRKCVASQQRVIVEGSLLVFVPVQCSVNSRLSFCQTSMIVFGISFVTDMFVEIIRFESRVVLRLRQFVQSTLLRVSASAIQCCSRK